MVVHTIYILCCPQHILHTIYISCCPQHILDDVHTIYFGVHRINCIWCGESGISVLYAVDTICICRGSVDSVPYGVDDIYAVDNMVWTSCVYTVGDIGYAVGICCGVHLLVIYAVGNIWCGRPLSTPYTTCCPRYIYGVGIWCGYTWVLPMMWDPIRTLVPGNCSEQTFQFCSLSCQAVNQRPAVTCSYYV